MEVLASMSPPVACCSPGAAARTGAHAHRARAAPDLGQPPAAQQQAHHDGACRRQRRASWQPSELAADGGRAVQQAQHHSARHGNCRAEAGGWQPVAASQRRRRAKACICGRHCRQVGWRAWQNGRGASSRMLCCSAEEIHPSTSTVSIHDTPLFMLRPADFQPMTVPRFAAHRHGTAIVARCFWDFGRWSDLWRAWRPLPASGTGFEECMQRTRTQEASLSLLVAWKLTLPPGTGFTDCGIRI